MKLGKSFACEDAQVLMSIQSEERRVGFTEAIVSSQSQRADVCA